MCFWQLSTRFVRCILHVVRTLLQLVQATHNLTLCLWPHPQTSDLIPRPLVSSKDPWPHPQTCGLIWSATRDMLPRRLNELLVCIDSATRYIVSFHSHSWQSCQLSTSSLTISVYTSVLVFRSNFCKTKNVCK